MSDDSVTTTSGWHVEYDNPLETAMRVVEILSRRNPFEPSKSNLTPQEAEVYSAALKLVKEHIQKGKA